MNESKKREIVYYSFSIIIVIAIFSIIVAGVLKIRATEPDGQAVDEEIRMFVESQSEMKVADVIENMNDISISRHDATLESIEESVRQSVEESMDEYFRESEQASMEESVAQSIAQSIAQSEAESIFRAVAQMEASVEAAIGRGELRPGEVVMTSAGAIPVIRKLFENTMVIGDSRAKGIVDFDILTESNVAYFGGASVGTLFDTTKQAAEQMKEKALFIVGLNDCGWYHGDAARFKADYIRLIGSYLEINPEGRIYLQEILPVKESGRFAWPMMDYIPQFNVAIKEICDEYGYTYVSATQYCLPKYVCSRDGAHFNLQFYLLWAQTIANQMGLWEKM